MDINIAALKDKMEEDQWQIMIPIKTINLNWKKIRFFLTVGKSDYIEIKNAVSGAEQAKVDFPFLLEIYHIKDIELKGSRNFPEGD